MSGPNELQCRRPPLSSLGGPCFYICKRQWGARREEHAACSVGSREVAVGIRLTPYPPHRSGRADFPHPALASGGDAQTARGIRMADMGRRQPAADEPLHTLPLNTSLLAPSFESMVPEVTDREAKVGQCV